jgi:hypothetical protein
MAFYPTPTGAPISTKVATPVKKTSTSVVNKVTNALGVSNTKVPTVSKAPTVVKSGATQNLFSKIGGFVKSLFTTPPQYKNNGLSANALSAFQKDPLTGKQVVNSVGSNLGNIISGKPVVNPIFSNNSYKGVPYLNPQFSDTTVSPSIAPGDFNPVLGGGNITNAQKGYGALGGTSPTTNPNITPNIDKSILDIANNLPETKAPTDISMITPGFIGTELPGTTPNNTQSQADLANARAIAEANQKAIEMAMQDKQQNITQDSALQLAQNNQNSALSGLLGTRKSMMDIAGERQSMSDFYGIAAQQAHVNSLNAQLDQMVQARDNQIAQANGDLASRDFANNQITQITRASDPVINKLSGDIKFYTAVLTQNKEMVTQAVSDWTKTMENQLNMYKDYMDANKDTIARLSKPIQDAADKAWELQKLKIQHNYSMTEKYASDNYDKGIANSMVKGQDGYVDPYKYVQVRANAIMSPTEFDARYGHLVNPQSANVVGFKQTQNTLYDGSNIPANTKADLIYTVKNNKKATLFDLAAQFPEVDTKYIEDIIANR